MLSRFADAALTRSEMKNVKGGGNCGSKCYWKNGAMDSQWNLTMAKAKRAKEQCDKSGGRGWWCCASC